jgi:hypothetical protein
MSYRIPRDVAYVVREDLEGRPVVYLMRLPVTPPAVLRETAASIWLLASDGVEDVVAGLRESMGCRADAMAADTHSFLRDLERRGLLEEL